jgi:hypothetical protein
MDERAQPGWATSPGSRATGTTSSPCAGQEQPWGTDPQRLIVIVLAILLLITIVLVGELVF